MVGAAKLVVSGEKTSTTPSSSSITATGSTVGGENASGNKKASPPLVDPKNYALDKTGWAKTRTINYSTPTPITVLPASSMAAQAILMHFSKMHIKTLPKELEAPQPQRSGRPDSIPAQSDTATATQDKIEFELPAALRVFKISELTKHILGFLNDPQDIWSCMGAYPLFREAILDTPILQWRAFINPSKPSKETDPSNRAIHIRSRPGQIKTFPHYQHGNCVNPMIEKPIVLLTSTPNLKCSDKVWAITKFKKEWMMSRRTTIVTMQVKKINAWKDCDKVAKPIPICSELRLDTRVADPCVTVIVKAEKEYKNGYRGGDSKAVAIFLKPGATVRELADWLNTPSKEIDTSDTITAIETLQHVGDDPWLLLDRLEGSQKEMQECKAAGKPLKTIGEEAQARQDAKTDALRKKLKNRRRGQEIFATSDDDDE